MSFLIVNRHNLASLSLTIKQSIQNASFISIDTEFTGLGGQNRQTRAQNIEERYSALRKVAESHSVIAVGLSIFTAVKSNEKKIGKNPNAEYEVENYHFVLLSLLDHQISPSSMTFLVQHGFDFNDQYMNGIPYYPGDVEQVQDEKEGGKSLSMKSIKNLECNNIFRGLIIDILHKKCPIVFHNGLLDLLFLYQSFYAQLPSTLPVFIADCSEMFQGAGLFDTKFISDFITRESASFLSLLFRKYQRLQMIRQSEGKPFVSINIKDPVTFKPVVNGAKLYELGLAPNPKSKYKTGKTSKSYCEQYANHGFCADGKDCLLSHDLDTILDEKDGPLPPSAKKLKFGVDDDNSTLKDQSSSQIILMMKKGNLFEQDHSACYDAFMTGFVFAHQLMAEENVLAEARNKIYLIGKQIPLLIEKSKYAKPSSSHLAQKVNYQGR